MSDEKKTPGTWWWFRGDHEGNYHVGFLVGYDEEGDEVWKDEDGDSGRGVSSSISSENVLYEFEGCKGFEDSLVIPDIPSDYVGKYRHLTPPDFRFPAPGDAWISKTDSGVILDYVDDMPKEKRWIVEMIPEESVQTTFSRVAKEVNQAETEAMIAHVNQKNEQQTEPVQGFVMYTYVNVDAETKEPKTIFQSPRRLDPVEYPEYHLLTESVFTVPCSLLQKD